MLATLIVSLRLTPIYESTATMDIDRQMPTNVLGQEPVKNTDNDADQFLATQVKMIQSDSVLRPVVDKFHLREVEKDALEEAIDKSHASLEAPVILKNLQSRGLPILTSLNQLSLAAIANSPPTSPMKSRYPISSTLTHPL